MLRSDNDMLFYMLLYEVNIKKCEINYGFMGFLMVYLDIGSLWSIISYIHFGFLLNVSFTLCIISIKVIFSFRL